MAIKRNLVWLLSITGWLILGTWLVAPLLALGIAYLLNPWFRGYGASLLIVGLVNGIARWIFLITGLISSYAAGWKHPAMGARQLLLYFARHGVLFLTIFSVVCVLWAKLLFLTASNDPLWQITLKEHLVLDPLQVLTIMGGTLSTSFGDVIGARWGFLLYLALKFVLIFLIIYSAIRVSYGRALSYEKRHPLFAISLAVWTCSLLGFPPVRWSPNEERLIILTYEAGWFLIAGLAGRVWGNLLRYDPQAQIDGEVRAGEP